MIRALPEFDIIDPSPGVIPDDAIEAVVSLLLDAIEREAVEAEVEGRPE